MGHVLKPEDLYKFRNVGDAQVSPDGSKVLFTVSQADKKSDKNLTNIWVFDVSSKEGTRLTSSGKDRFSRWSPDGKRIAFVSERSGKAQVWIMEVGGGEPWHLQTEQAVKGAPVWSPDGKFIAFTSRAFVKNDDWVPYPGAPEWDKKRAESQAEKALAGKSKRYEKHEDNEKRSVSDVKVITRLKYRFDGIGYLGDLTTHVFIVAVPGLPPESGEVKGAVRRLTKGDYDHEELAYSPDGKYLLVAALRRQDADYLQKQDLWLVEAATGKTVWLMDGVGPCRGAAWAPNGERIAFVGHDNSHRGSTTEALWVLEVGEFIKELETREVISGPKPLSMKDAVNLTGEFDRPLGNRVSSDMRYDASVRPFLWECQSIITFLACDKGATGVFQVSLDKPGPEIKAIWHDPGQNVAAISKTGGTFVLQKGSPTEPDNLYLFDGTRESGEQLCVMTDFNGWLGQISLGRCEKFTYKGDKDWDIDGWMLYPPGYQEGERRPTVLFIHGGPHGVYGAAFRFEHQVFASKGYAVLYTNPRGSQSYGQEFACACVRDWGGSDFKDIMAGVDYAVSLGVADPSKLFVTGWSYGGYMTSWTVTQTSRFKAAIAGAIVSNRYSMWGTSDIPFFGENHWGGLPWEAHEEYFERAPISFVTRVETPVMFIHGEGDLRCPVSQSEEFYLSLRRLGKTAVLVRYPDQFHVFSRPYHKFDRYERMLSWFDYYAGLETAGE